MNISILCFIVAFLLQAAPEIPDFMSQYLSSQVLADMAIVIGITQVVMNAIGNKIKGMLAVVLTFIVSIVVSEVKFYALHGIVDALVRGLLSAFAATLTYKASTKTGKSKNLNILELATTLFRVLRRTK